jgi:thymidylate synthase (FAD)
MKGIYQSVELLTKINQVEVLKTLELYGRNCYKSEHKITRTSYKAFVELLLKRKHMSVLEHIQLTFRLITDRGMLAEITRHRHASYSVESTRYVNYKECVFVYPFYHDGRPQENKSFDMWQSAMLHAEEFYRFLIEDGNPPEIARSVLPMSLATNIVMTCNLREWLYILNLRMSKGVHPQMVELMRQVYKILNNQLPLIFNEKTVQGVV